MGKQKLLSIVMPTYNRCEMLKYTMPQMMDMIVKNADDVEFIICDNASTDDTEQYLLSIYEEKPCFKLINYEDHVEIGESIRRSIDNVRSNHFLLWSDDDIPAPMMVDILLDKIRKYPDIECITFNRLQGMSSRSELGIHDCKTLYKDYTNSEHLYEDGCDFVRERWRGMAFLSSDLVSMKAWKRGMELYPNNHYGWEYLAPILYGVSGGKCLYVEYPLCIQRCLYQPSYRVKWASYLYLSMPRVLETLQEKGVVDDWRVLYKDYMTNGQFSSSIFGYAFNMIYWATFDKPYYRPLIKEINHYQHSIINKMLTYGILTPDFILKPLKYMIKGVFTLMGKRNYV